MFFKRLIFHTAGFSINSGKVQWSERNRKVTEMESQQGTMCQWMSPSNFLKQEYFTMKRVTDTQRTWTPLIICKGEVIDDNTWHSWWEFKRWYASLFAILIHKLVSCQSYLVSDHQTRIKSTPGIYGHSNGVPQKNTYPSAAFKKQTTQDCHKLDSCEVKVRISNYWILPITTISSQMFLWGNREFFPRYFSKNLKSSHCSVLVFMLMLY